MKANVPQITLVEIPKKGPNFHASLPLAMQQQQVRNVSWNPEFTGKQFTQKWGHNLLALAVFLTGKEAEVKCGGCNNHRGPFDKCVLPPDDV